jgi:hypothetical protein
LDRRRRRPAAALAGLGLALAAAALAAPAGPPIRAMLWVPSDVDPVRAFATAPGECLQRPRDPATALSVEVGRAAFRTPVVLGGQAARAGLSCESCHRAGRSNPDFQFPGISGAPGTADVTSSLFSTHRGNRLDDPRPIPDLSGPRDRLKVDQAPAAARLEPFIHGLIVEEFDGPEPSPAVLRGLAAYVRALNPAACPAQARERLSVALLMDDARRALAAAQAMAARGDRPTAVTMVAGARARLGLIDERFADPALAQERAALRAADARLAQAQAALREGRADAPGALSDWLSGSRGLEAALARREPASLFDRGHMARAAKRRLPG